MIFVTGDTHGTIDIAKLKSKRLQRYKLTRNDFVIIAGDFGGVWSGDTIERYICLYSALPYTVLFVDGNHENHHMLRQYPITDYKGGRTHKISDNVYHLMRGQIFKLEDKKFFTFGGAESIDRMYRTEGKNWWKEEVPNDRDYDEARKNLKKAKNRVDYIITHSADARTLCLPSLVATGKEVFETNTRLLEFEDTVEYSGWFFGHYHIDKVLPGKKIAVYNEVYKLPDGGNANTIQKI